MAWIGVIALIAAINWVFGFFVAAIVLAVVALLLYFALKGFDGHAATSRDDKSVAGQHGRRFFAFMLWPVRLRTYRDPDPYRTMVEKATAHDSHHAGSQPGGWRDRRRQRANELDAHIRHIKHRQ